MMLFNSLPWFIRQTIIDVCILDHPKLSLINKEWFKYSSKQFMRLDGGKLDLDYPLSSWFKLAGNLKLTNYTNLNWEFLRGCPQLTEGSLELSLRNNLDPLIKFVRGSSLKYLELLFESGMQIEGCESILMGIHYKLRSLRLLYCCNSNLDEIISLEYPLLRKFEVININKTTIDFHKLHHNMPRVEYVMLEIDNFLSSNYRQLTFNYLSTLILRRYKKRESLDSNIINIIFKFNFPVLTTLKLSGDIKNINMERVSKIMPKLETLSLEIKIHDESNQPFPSHPLPNLKKLFLSSQKHYNEKLTIPFNLNNVPKLRELEIVNYFYFLQPVKSNSSPITCLKTHRAFSFPNQSIFKQLPNINQITINCHTLNDNLSDLLTLCCKATSLTLTNINNEFPPLTLPKGPFKISNLSLQGHHYLSDTLLIWLSNIIQLTNLTIQYHSNKPLQLQQITFKYVKELNVECYSANNRHHLQSILQCPRGRVAFINNRTYLR